MVLGVAFDWGKRKGLDVFIRLADYLDEKYQIVLVGTDACIDELLPQNIISIHRTSNQTELAEIYSAADVFVNPTREDNYPTVNLEAIACGTPVLTFQTGGSPEAINGDCGSVVPCDVELKTMEHEILSLTKNQEIKSLCRKKSMEFDKFERFEEYVELYTR